MPRLSCRSSQTAQRTFRRSQAIARLEGVVGVDRGGAEKGRRDGPAMITTSKQKLGPDELIAPIGAGGMGEVFRARDTGLNREVAIKVLPKEFATASDRLRRF